jgi:hypothetical protein
MKVDCQKPHKLFCDQNAEVPVCTANVLQKLCVLCFSVKYASC